MPRTYCPSCDAVISVDKPRLGATVSCPECGVELEVISTSPFELDFPFDDEWDDEWDFCVPMCGFERAPLARDAWASA